jgi:hypothetical protein
MKILLWFSLFTFSWFFESANTNNNSIEKIALCGKKASSSGPNIADPAVAATLPTFAKNNAGQTVLYWTEKDAQSTVSLYFATTTDGSNFSDKKLIFASPGLGNGKLAKPKILFKKNGEMVALFSHRAGGPMPPREPRPAAPAAMENHAGHDMPAKPTAPVARPKRDSHIQYMVSKDNGASWSTAQNVDADTSKLTRGFFDAVVLPNDEIAVAYLKDVKNSTKHEERDLRMTITKNGSFQQEKLIDAIVCDCCSISMHLDAKGALHVIYRDNNNDIRDMAHIISTDNANSFSAPKPLYQDNWEIKGCPHAGATTVSTATDIYATWFSGTAKSKAGLRVANGKGKLVTVLKPSAKNANLYADAKNVLLLWEQPVNEEGTNIHYSKITGKKAGATTLLPNSQNGQNATATKLANGQTLIAYEYAPKGEKSSIKTALVN